LRRIVPMVVGAVLLVVGAAWAAQGAKVIGGSSLMDGNTIFIFLGGVIALIGLALLAYGAVSKPKAPAASPSA
jgi:hypothetical protein